MDQLGTFNGKLYALVFKAANKSLVWYNVPAFKDAGVTPPKTWTQFLKDANTLQASGTPAFSIGGSDGWTLTDLFENIYLRSSGRRSTTRCPRTRSSGPTRRSTTALKSMAQIIGNSTNIAGGTSGALQPDSTTRSRTRSDRRRRQRWCSRTTCPGRDPLVDEVEAEDGLQRLRVPIDHAGPGANAVEIGGDLFVTFRDTPAIEAFVKFLASAPAAEAWAKQGGFATGNHNVTASVYPDAITRATASPIAKAKRSCSTCPTQQPASFGATTGQGEWGIFQQFLKSPTDVSGIQKKLEAAATAAYKKGK